MHSVRRRISLLLFIFILFTSVRPSAVEAEPEDVLTSGSEGEAVLHLQMRLRDLGYYNYKITGSFGALTESAVKEFQLANSLTPDGAVGEKTAALLYSDEVKRKPAAEPAKAPPATPTPAPTKSAQPTYGKLVNWSTVSGQFPRGSSVKVIDLWTGISYTMVRVGGSLHADVEPATKDDTAKLKKTYGGVWSWDRRPVIVKVNGEWVAASTNGMPHGYETVSGNGMTGQVCIHFLGSKTHIRGIMDSDHQAMVRRAAGQ